MYYIDFPFGSTVTKALPLAFIYIYFFFFFFFKETLYDSLFKIFLMITAIELPIFVSFLLTLAQVLG